MKTAKDIAVIRGWQEREQAIKEYAEQHREKAFNWGWMTAGGFPFNTTNAREKFKQQNPLT